jgi:uncharacterized protein YndB with AHSA1/START domain
MTEQTAGASATAFTLPSDREVVMECIFDAPREAVFKAYEDPQLIPMWWGPARLTTAVEEMDVRPGGAWRYVQRDAAGNEYAFHGEYREVLAPERLVYTFEFEGEPGHVVLCTVLLEEHAGRTWLRATDLFASNEDRDGMLQAGMEQGAREGNDRLAELLAKRDRALSDR